MSIDRTTTKERLLVFIPMYRCEAQIPRVIAQFSQNEWFAKNVAILCVDNCSPDGTAEAAKRALDICPVPEKYLVRNNRNYGLGGSHKVAFKFAQQQNFDYVIVLHGDDQGSISDLLPFLLDDTYKKFDALLGARFMHGAKLTGYSILRTSANYCFNFIFSIVARKRLFDLGSGLNMFRRAPFDSGFHIKYDDDLTFNYYLIFGLMDYERSYTYFPINWREDDQISNAKLFSQGLKMLRILGDRISSRERFLIAEHRHSPQNDYTFTLQHQWIGSKKSSESISV